VKIKAVVRMMPFGVRSRKFTAAVPVTPASAAGSAAAPPIGVEKINPDTARADAVCSAATTATTATTTTTTQTPTRNVRRLPSAPPTTPTASTFRGSGYNLRSSSISSTPESSLNATYTTPTTIATLYAVVSKIALPTAKSSRGGDDDESPSDENYKNLAPTITFKDCDSNTTEDPVDREDVIDNSPTTGPKTSTRIGTGGRTSSTTNTTTIGASVVGTKGKTDKTEVSKGTKGKTDKTEVSKGTNASAESSKQMANGQPATIPSASPAPTTKVYKNEVRNSENSNCAPPSSTKGICDSNTDVNMIDVGATAENKKHIQSPCQVKDMMQHNDDDDKYSESKTNDAATATHPTTISGSCSSLAEDKMGSKGASAPTVKTEETSVEVPPSDRLFAFDPNTMDDVLDLSGNECDTIVVGPSPADYIHETLHGGRDGGRDGSKFCHEQYACHNHYHPYEEGYYYPPPGGSHHQYPPYHPNHNHQLGIVSPAAVKVAGRPSSIAPTLSSAPSVPMFNYMYDPNPPGTFRDESAHVDGVDKATGGCVANSLPWSPIKTPKPKKTRKDPQKKLLTNTGTNISVKVGGMEIPAESDEPPPPRPRPRPRPHLSPPHHHHQHVVGEPQIQYYRPNDHQNVVSVLHSSPPKSPTPSVSSASMQEAVLKVREEFSNDGGCDRLGTAPSMCAINRDAGIHIYAPNPVVPVPHTIALCGSRDSRSGVVTEVSVSSLSASRRTTPSTSTFMSGYRPYGELMGCGTMHFSFYYSLCVVFSFISLVICIGA